MNLNVGATYHVCPKREWFSSFEKLDGGLVLMGDDYAVWKGYVLFLSKYSMGS